jgi:hypothetical protein
MVPASSIFAAVAEILLYELRSSPVVAEAVQMWVLLLGNCMGIPPGIGGHTHTHTRRLPVPTLGVRVSAAGNEI